VGVEIAAYAVIEWSMAALLALGVTVLALKVFRLAPLWAVVVGMVVFTLLFFPITTHAVLLKMLPPKSK
jgi:hypothetical protein